MEQCIQLWSESLDYDKDTLNNEISLQEAADVMKKLKNGKSPSPDNIPNELIKYGGSGLAKIMTDQFNEIIIPPEWLYGHITQLYKGKGSKDDLKPTEG